jgi:hypothetical protein
VFATGGTQLKGKTPDGTEYGLTLDDVWKANGITALHVFGEVSIAIEKTIDEDNEFKKKHLGEKTAEQYADKIARDLVNHLGQKELYFVKHTDIPRNFVTGEHLIRNPDFSVNQAKYTTIAAKAQEKALSALSGEIHHIVPLYLGGGSEAASLMAAEGGAGIAGSAHNAMHEFIDDLKIGKTLGVKNAYTLDWQSLGGTFPDDTLKIIIGTVKQDGSITYKETALAYKVEQNERGIP